MTAIVPVGEYCGVVGERNLSDAAWLAPRVRRHAELVNWTMQWSPVFPIPFGTFYKTFDSLTAFMRVHEEAILAFLNGVTDKEQWELLAGAKFDDPELLDRLACDAWPDWLALSKGVRYMRSCRDREALLAFGRANAAGVVRDYLAEIQASDGGHSRTCPRTAVGLESRRAARSLCSACRQDERPPIARNVPRKTPRPRMSRSICRGLGLRSVSDRI